VREYIVSVDIAAKRDRYAEIVMRDIIQTVQGAPEVGIPDRWVHTYQIVWAKQQERMRYDQMEDSTLSLVGRPDLRNNCELLVDGTGVGDPFVEHLRGRNAYPVPIIFTSGGSVHDVYDDAGHVFGEWADRLSVKTLKEIRVPKKDLVSAGALMLQQHRLIIGKKIKHKDALVAQLNGFRGEVNKQTGRIRYEAEFEELHDDLIVCYLMAAWWAIVRRPILAERELPAVGAVRVRSSASWEPAELDNALIRDTEEQGPPHQVVQSWR